MVFERIRDADDPRMGEAMALYGESFPYHEQREADSQRAVMSREAYRFLRIVEDGRFAGLLLCWDVGGMTYVEHFCMLPALRGQGLGRRALEKLAAEGRPVVLEIDPPADELSRRRLGFYERCGFCQNPYAHVHPPYHRGMEGHALMVLSRPGALDAQAYKAFAAYLRGEVCPAV